MKTVSLLAQKGGAGKTTLAVHLAVLAEQEGFRVLMVDIDPQQSVGDWWRAREADTPPLVETTADELPDVLSAAETDGVDLTIIDTAPHADQAAVKAARFSDLVVIPCRPSVLDLRAIGKTVDLVRAINRPAVLVLNSCPPPRLIGEASLTSEARRALKGYGLPIAPVAITQRVSLAHALIDGRAVSELEPQGKAAAELRKLWTWIAAQLKAG